MPHQNQRTRNFQRSSGRLSIDKNVAHTKIKRAIDDGPHQPAERAQYLTGTFSDRSALSRPNSRHKDLAHPQYHANRAQCSQGLTRPFCRCAKPSHRKDATKTRSSGRFSVSHRHLKPNIPHPPKSERSLITKPKNCSGEPIYAYARVI